MLKENLEKIKEKWKLDGLKLKNPFSKEELIKRFAKVGITLSQDVIDFYSSIDGFDENEMDSECLTFWTIEKILKENETDSKEIYFADFLIDSHQYFFKYKNAEYSEVFIRYSETDKHKIADSFDDFFELYLKDINSLFI